MEFIKSYWFIIIGIFVLVPYAKAFLKKMAVKNEVDNVSNQVSQNSQINALDNPLIQMNEADKILKNYSKAQRERFKADVQQYAYHMGTATGLSWWQTLTENDAKAVVILNTWIQHLPKFSELYYGVYTESRNLKTDFNKLTDESEKQKVYAQQKKYNLKFF